jgi:hypothetical protein
LLTSRISAVASLTGEFCYFQLRIICELIALACLTAHGDIQGTKSNRLQEAYQADLIIKALTKLHAKFYPVPSIQSENKIDGSWQRTYLTDGFLTKPELLRCITNPVTLCTGAAIPWSLQGGDRCQT